MAAKDFTANQIRTAKLILTGGFGVKNLGLAVYTGSISTNNIGGVSDGALYTNVGADTTVFFSGSNKCVNSATGGVVLFGGDTVTSGTVHAYGDNGGAITGSITRTKEGKSYLVAGAGITIATGSNGQVTFTSSGAQNLFQTVQITANGGSVAGDSSVVADSTTDTLTLSAGSNVTITGNSAGDQITIAAAGGGGGGNTLDAAYDQGGSGAGRAITADAGPVQIDTTGAAVGLAITGSAASGVLVEFFKASSVLDADLRYDNKKSLIIQNNIGGIGEGHIFINPVDSNSNIVLGNTTTTTRLVFNGNDVSTPSAPFIATDGSGNARGFDIQVPTAQSVVINDDGHPSDLRIESDNLPGAIFVDGDKDIVGLGTAETTHLHTIEGVGADVGVVLSGSTEVKNSDGTFGSLALATGDLVASGTFYSGFIDAGERLTFGLDAGRQLIGDPQQITGSTSYPPVNLITAGKNIASGITHIVLRRLGAGGANKADCFGFMTQIPDNATHVNIQMPVLQKAGSNYSAQLFLSASHIHGRGGLGQAPFASGSTDFGAVTLIDSEYTNIQATFPLLDIDCGLPGPNRGTGIFLIGRKDTNGGSDEPGNSLNIPAINVIFKM